MTDLDASGGDDGAADNVIASGADGDDIGQRLGTGRRSVRRPSGGGLVTGASPGGGR